jgi:hypothetical protein
MEPLLIGETSRHRGALTDLAVELAKKMCRAGRLFDVEKWIVTGKPLEAFVTRKKTPPSNRRRDRFP